MMFKDGGTPVFGRLPTDRPHQFKMQFIYQFTFGTSIGVEPVRGQRPAGDRARSASTRRQQLPVQYLGRDQRRPDAHVLADGPLLQHEFRLGGATRLQFSFNVLNLFNQDAAISKFSTYQRTTSVTTDEALFYPASDAGNR